MHNFSDKSSLDIDEFQLYIKTRQILNFHMEYKLNKFIKNQDYQTKARWKWLWSANFHQKRDKNLADMYACV